MPALKSKTFDTSATPVDPLDQALDEARQLASDALRIARTISCLGRGEQRIQMILSDCAGALHQAFMHDHAKRP
jgi:hypothetical protein